MVRRACHLQEAHVIRKLSLLAAGLALAANVAFADTTPRKDRQVFNDIANSVNRYAQFTIFDDISASVRDGVVTLTGKVTMPYKRDDIEKRVAKIAGVQRVDDRITVLPVSSFDDELRR